MEHLRCVVERITYQNAENGYTVLKCAVKNYSDLVTVVGTMPDTHVGSVLSLEGMWKMDAKYGRQFSVEKFEETLPATVYGIQKYLGSGLIKGVGPKFAKRIVEKFGKDTLDVIEDTPDKLLKVPGIGKVRVDRIKTSWQEQKEIKNIMLFLQSHEVSTSHATKIFKTYGSESIAIVKENPYRLADDIWGIGFKTADSIAQKMGIDKGKFVRLRSGIFYALNKLAEAGHCYATREQLIGKARELLEVEEPEIKITLDEMIRINDVVRDAAGEQEAIYLPPYYFSESGCAKRLLRLMAYGKKKSENIEEILKKVAASLEITYDEIQWQAVKTAISSKVMVLTGGPGTGKTTTTLGIISAYKQAGCQIILAAPTGRAAKRMSEATTKRSLIFNELNKELYRKFFMNRNELQACKDGYIYIHDQSARLDTMNCCLFDVGAVLKGGFEMGNVWYNEPKTLDTAFDVMGDIILSTAAQQYGGFTVPEVDKILGPYAQKSYDKYISEFMKYSDENWTGREEKAVEYALDKVRRDFDQGWQGIEYKLNTVG